MDEFPETHVAIPVCVKVVEHFLCPLWRQVEFFLKHLQSIDLLKSSVDGALCVFIENTLYFGSERKNIRPEISC